MGGVVADSGALGGDDMRGAGERKLGLNGKNRRFKGR